MEEDDSSQIRKKKKQPRPLYSIEYSQPEPPPPPPSLAARGQHQQQRQHRQHPHHHDDDDDEDEGLGGGGCGGVGGGVSPKPMTPRRVKRRSVISRDGTRRSSRRSSSARSSARRKNPVNWIMDQQESLYANSPPPPPPGALMGPPGLVGGLSVGSLSQGALNYDRISGRWDRDRILGSNPSWQPDGLNVAASSPNIWNHPDSVAAYHNVVGPNFAPSNWESASSTRNLIGADNWQHHHQQQQQQQQQKQHRKAIGAGDGGPEAEDAGDPPGGPLQPDQWQGQANPSFQRSSTQSLNGEDLDDLYGNRPASARSSYSNYHGVRATPQVPSRSDIVRQSQRQFVMSGPPAYQDTVI